MANLKTLLGEPVNKPASTVDVKSLLGEPVNKPESAPLTDETTKTEAPTPVDEQGMKSHFAEAIAPKTSDFISLINKKEAVQQGVNTNLLKVIGDAASKAERPAEFIYKSRNIGNRLSKIKEYFPELAGQSDIIANQPINPQNIDKIDNEVTALERNSGANWTTISAALNNPQIASSLTGRDKQYFDYYKSTIDTKENAAARTIMEDNSKLAEASKAIDRTGDFAGVINVLDGLFGGVKNYFRDYITMRDQVRSNPKMQEVFSKIEKLNSGENVELTTDDRLLAKMYVDNANLHKSIDDRIPTTYKVGEMAGQSAGFTAEFLLTSPVGGGLAKGITKGVTAGSSLGKRFGVGLAAKLAQTGVQVPAMPTFYKGIAKDVSGGENFGESLFKNYYNTFAENFTERIFLKNPWNKSTVGAVDNFMGRLGVNMHTDKGLVGVLASTGEEVLEEKIGEVMQAPLNYDNFNTFWKDFWDVKKNAELIGSVALMVAPMGIVSYSAKKWDDVQLNKVGKQIPGEIRSQLDEVLNDQKLSLKEQYDLVGRIVQDHANNQTLGENPAETAGNILRYTEGKTRQAVVSAVEDRAKTPTIGEMEEITTEDQAKVDYLEGQGVKIPDGTSMTKVNEMYEAEKAKNVPETVETIAQEEVPTKPEVVPEQLSSPENISPETQTEVLQKENISEPTQEKVSDIQMQKSESQPTTIQETEKSLQNEKVISENENLNLQKDEKQEVRGQETTGKEVIPEEKKIKEAAIKVADTLRKAKFVQSMDDLSKLSSDPTALLKVAWDGSVEAAAKAIELGGSVAQAVADGVKTLKESDWYKKLSDESKKIAEERFAKDIEDHLKEQNYATENGTSPETTGSQASGMERGEEGRVRVRSDEKGGVEAEKGTESEKKAKVRRSRYGTRVAFGKKTPKSIKEKYAKEKLYEYKEETHGTVDEAADKYLAGATTEQAMKALHDNEIPRRVRTGIAVGLIKRLNEESTPLYQKGDKAAADKIMDDIVLLHDFIQKEIATESGRDISYLGSNRVMELLGSYQTAELARRGMDKSRNEGMKKKSFKRTADFAQNEVEKEKKKVIDEVIEKIVKPKEIKVSPEIERIRKERSSLIDQWKKARKSTAYSAVIPGLTQADIEFIPQLAASYIKEGYYQTKVLVKKIQRVLDQEGIKVSDSDLETLLPKEYEGKPLSEYQQAEDLKKASLSLANQIFGDVIDKKSPESDPIVRMVKTLFSKFKETQLDRKKVEGMSDLEKLAYAIREKEKYKNVWIEAKQKALDIIENNKNLSDEQKEAAIERIETAYKNATQFTFSQKLVTDLIREELAEKGTDIGEVVRDHYESKDIIKADLVKSLVEKAGLDEKQAKLLADAVDKAFSTLMTARIQGVLKKYMEKSTRKATTKQKKGAEEIVHLASIGAFDNEKFREAFADMWGLPALDDADIKSIITQAEMITKIKSEAIRYQYKQQLLAKIANMQGMDWDALWDGFWYANVLSGFGTQTKNFLDAATASTVESMLYSGTKLSQISRWRKAYANALKGRGSSNAINTFRTGNHPFEFGTDAPKQAKRILDSEEALVRNKAAWKAIRIAARYSNSVFNLMMSNDALWNTVAYESILDALVTKDLYKEAGIKWWNRLSKEHKAELNQKIDEALRITPAIRETIKKMVDQESEAFKQVQAGLGEKQIGFTEMQAKLRKYEIMDEMRPKLLVEEARRLAQMTLGNINPYGTLGYLMSFVSSAVNTIGFKIYRPMVIKSEDGKYHFTVSSTESMTLRPLAKIIPFTRIITAIASRALGWNPLVMGMRYKLGVGFLTSIGGKRTERFRRQLTDHEKKVIVKKAILLASTYSMLYAMSGGDEPEDGWIRVTANGTGDWTKNKQLEASGWRPYSIQFGDFSISYQYVYPLNGILGAFGYARDQQLYKGADKSFSSFMKLLGEGSAVSLAQVLFSTPMSGLNSVLDLMTNIFRGETGTASGQITKLLANIGGGFVAPRVLKDMEATYDILAERSDIEGVTFWEKMSDKVPFVGRNFAGKVERLDMFGDSFKVKSPFAAVLEKDVSRPTSDLARWVTEEIKYYRPIPDINREKFILMEKGGETDLARPLTGGSDTEEALWTEYNRKLGQLFKEKAMELKASGDTNEEIKKEFELAWDDIVTEAKAYVLEKSEAHPLDKP